MAEEKDKISNSADALHAMASGDHSAASDEDASPAANTEPTPVEPPSEGIDLGVDVPTTPQTAASRSARMTARAGQRHAHHFKQFMIPLLLVVAVMLLIMATVMWNMYDGAQAAREKSFLKRNSLYFIAAAFPLAVLLLGGAVWFWLDVRKAGRTR